MLLTHKSLLPQETSDLITDAIKEHGPLPEDIKAAYLEGKDVELQDFLIYIDR